MKLTRSGKIILSLGLLAVVGLGIGGYFFWQVQDLRNHPEKVAIQETERIKNSVGRLMILPEENPTLATIESLDQLQGQVFFSKAEQGDKVLVFEQAKLAILYRPSIHKIVNVDRLIVSDATAETSGPKRITISSTSDATALATVVENKINEIDSAIEVTHVALTGSQAGVQVIDLSKKNDALANDLAGRLNGVVATSAPASKTPPANADLWILVGPPSSSEGE